MENPSHDDAREAKADAIRKQVYPNLGEVNPTDSVLDVARQARASLPWRVKILGWLVVAFLLWRLYALIESRPADQRVLAYWIVGVLTGAIGIFIAVAWIREDRRRKRLRDGESAGTPSGK